MHITYKVAQDPKAVTHFEEGQLWQSHSGQVGNVLFRFSHTTMCHDSVNDIVINRDGEIVDSGLDSVTFDSSHLGYKVTELKNKHVPVREIPVGSFVKDPNEDSLDIGMLIAESDDKGRLIMFLSGAAPVFVSPEDYLIKVRIKSVEWEEI